MGATAGKKALKWQDFSAAAKNGSSNGRPGWPAGRSATPRIGSLSASLEDYLKIIFNLSAEKQVARVCDIAKAKKVKMSSVTSALKRLDRQGLVEYRARQYAILTPAGISLAQRLLRRHSFLTAFFSDILRIDHKTAELDACSIEHSLSPLTVKRLHVFCEYLHSGQPRVRQVVDEFLASLGKLGH